MTTRRTLLAGLGLLMLPTTLTAARSGSMLIDDFSGSDFVSTLGTRWRGVSDRVMGGVSVAHVTREHVDGRSRLRLSGDVRLDNNGGFIQAALDLSPAGEPLDASDYKGLRLTVRGNGERYSLHLRTPDTVRPWQSYRAHFAASAKWEVIDLPFAAFEPYRVETPLDAKRIRRIGLVAIGRAFFADLSVARLEFYR